MAAHTYADSSLEEASPPGRRESFLDPLNGTPHSPLEEGDAERGQVFIKVHSGFHLCQDVHTLAPQPAHRAREAALETGEEGKRGGGGTTAAHERHSGCSRRTVPTE